MKLALVHDYLNQYGGAERLLESEMEIWPDAPVYTSIYDSEVMKSFGFSYSPERIKTSFMQSFPLKRKLNKHFFFIYPHAFKQFDFSPYDIVLSDSSYSAKYLPIKKPTIHIAYIHTPPRFLWGYDQELTSLQINTLDKFLSPLYKMLVPPLKNIIRKQDYEEVQKIDYLLCNSKSIAAKIKDVYKREATVIYPPVETDRFSHAPVDQKLQEEGYYLVVSRLGGYKRIDVAIQAFNELGLPLKIIGTGPEENQLKRLANENVQFLGRLPDEVVARYMKNAKAFIFPTEEDFGIVCIEASAAGIPVLAFKSGGAIETVIENETGLFFESQNAKALKGTVERFANMKFDRKKMTANAERFTKEKFQKEIKAFVESKIEN